MKHTLVLTELYRILKPSATEKIIQFLTGDFELESAKMKWYVLSFLIGVGFVWKIPSKYLNLEPKMVRRRRVQMCYLRNYFKNMESERISLNFLRLRNANHQKSLWYKDLRLEVIRYNRVDEPTLFEPEGELILKVIKNSICLNGSLDSIISVDRDPYLMDIIYRSKYLYYDIDPDILHHNDGTLNSRSYHNMILNMKNNRSLKQIDSLEISKGPLG